MFLFGFDSRGVPCLPFLALKVPGMQVTGCGFTKGRAACVSSKYLQLA